MTENFARWSVLLWQYLKRDWKKILFWIAGLGLFTGGFVPAFEELAKGQGLQGMYETMQNPAMVAMIGPSPVTQAADYTVGAMYANEMLLFSGLFAMIISALHVVSHTRKEEDLGLTELVRSFQVGRLANSFAVLVEVVLINLLLAAFIGTLMTSFGVTSMEVGGAYLFGASVGLAGLLGGVIALVFAQIMPNSSGATGVSLAIVGVLYTLRASSDVTNIDWSYWNPMGWTYLTHPFTANDSKPLLYGLVFSVVMTGVAFLLESRRDMGAGYLPEREGRAHAKATLLSVPGLLLRLNRGVIISWLVAFVLLGAAYGSIYGDMQTFLESNDLLKQMFTQSGVSLEASFTSTIMMILVGLAAILPIVLVNKLAAEENRGHLSQLFATKVSRGKWYWTTIFLAIVMGALGILLTAGGLGGAALAVMGDSTLSMSDFLAAGFNFLPAVLFFAGLAAVALGWLPGAGKVIYAYLAYSLLLNYFDGILDLPDWFLKTAIQSWLPQLPVADFEWVPFVVITLISIGLFLLGYVGYRQRDLSEGI